MLSPLCVVVLLLPACSGLSGSDGCTSDEACSLNGVCQNGACVCDIPWIGQSCGQLAFRPTPPGGAFGFGKPWATTSWGGNAVYQNSTRLWHLYVTEIQGEHTRALTRRSIDSVPQREHEILLLLWDARCMPWLWMEAWIGPARGSHVL